MKSTLSKTDYVHLDGDTFKRSVYDIKNGNLSDSKIKRMRDFLIAQSDRSGYSATMEGENIVIRSMMSKLMILTITGKKIESYIQPCLFLFADALFTGSVIEYIKKETNFSFYE